MPFAGAITCARRSARPTISLLEVFRRVRWRGISSDDRQDCRSHAGCYFAFDIASSAFLQKCEVGAAPWDVEMNAVESFGVGLDPRHPLPESARKMER